MYAHLHRCRGKIKKKIRDKKQATDAKHEHADQIYAKMRWDEWSRRNAVAIAAQYHNAFTKFQKRKLNNSYKKLILNTMQQQK